MLESKGKQLQQADCRKLPLLLSAFDAMKYGYKINVLLLGTNSVLLLN